MRFATCTAVLISTLAISCALPPPPPPAIELPAATFASAHRLTTRAEMPLLVQRKEPDVLPELRGVASDVSIEFLVDRTGAVTGSRRVAGDERFYAAAATAAQQWRFEPYLRNGQPADFVLPVRFILTWPDARRANVAIRFVTPD
jgi:TonB family protein